MAPETAAAHNIVAPRFGDPDRLPPARVLERLQRGGPEAGALVYDRFGDQVNRLVWRLMGADSEHSDVVHDVFCALLAGIHEVREPQALRGWVRAVTANTVRSVLRRRRLTRALGLRPGAEPDPDRFHGVCDDPEGRETLAAVFDILDGLPADLRIVFVLRFLEQLTLPEIAHAAGCSLATVKRRLTKAQGRFVRAARKVDGLAARVTSSPIFGGAS